MKWLILVLGIASNASASVLIKYALSPPQPPMSLARPMTLLTNLPLWCGLTLYGLAFVLYTVALAYLPLNVAHPILTSGAIATVAILSVLLFKESMPATSIVGLALVVIGVILIASKSV